MNEANASRTSLLALLSLFSGVLAVTMVLGSLCGVWITERSEVFFHPTLESYKVGFWSARIVAICAALPAFLALILWGAAGAAVRESEGKLRGMALYRTGFVLALASACGAYVIQAAAAEEWNRTRITARSNSSLSLEDRNDLESHFRTMMTQRLEGDAKGFASHFLPEVAPRVERWAAANPVRLGGRGQRSRIVRSYTVEEARRYPKGMIEFLDISLQNYRKDDMVVLENIEPSSIYWNRFVFRRVGNDWKVVGPVPE